MCVCWFLVICIRWARCRLFFVPIALRFTQEATFCMCSLACVSFIRNINRSTYLFKEVCRKEKRIARSVSILVFACKYASFNWIYVAFVQWNRNKRHILYKANHIDMVTNFDASLYLSNAREYTLDSDANLAHILNSIYQFYIRLWRERKKRCIFWKRIAFSRVYGKKWVEMGVGWWWCGHTYTPLPY